ncbi:unnamed protein product, partial [Phaeothamnion confervicola]
MDISDAFQQTREQVLLSGVSSHNRSEGLQVINSSNLEYLQPAQRAELFRLKGFWLAGGDRPGGQRAEIAEANAAFSLAVQICGTHGKAWFSWAKYNDGLFETWLAKRDMAPPPPPPPSDANGNGEAVAPEGDAMAVTADDNGPLPTSTPPPPPPYGQHAVACYLQAVQHGCKSARLMIGRVLLMLQYDTLPPPSYRTSRGHGQPPPSKRAPPQLPQELGLARLLEAHGERLPAWTWIPWIGQLMAGLQRPEAPHIVPLLVKLAQHYPQSLFYTLRCQLLKHRERIPAGRLTAPKNVRLLSGGSLVAPANTLLATVQQLQAGEITELPPPPPLPPSAAPLTHLEAVMAALKEAHPLLVPDLELFLGEIVLRMRMEPEEELLSYLQEYLTYLLRHTALQTRTMAGMAAADVAPCPYAIAPTPAAVAAAEEGAAAQPLQCLNGVRNGQPGGAIAGGAGSASGGGGAAAAAGGGSGAVLPSFGGEAIRVNWIGERVQDMWNRFFTDAAWKPRNYRLFIRAYRDAFLRDGLITLPAAAATRADADGGAPAAVAAAARMAATGLEAGEVPLLPEQAPWYASLDLDADGGIGEKAADHPSWMNADDAAAAAAALAVDGVAAASAAVAAHGMAVDDGAAVDEFDYDAADGAVAPPGSLWCAPAMVRPPQAAVTAAAGQTGPPQLTAAQVICRLKKWKHVMQERIHLRPSSALLHACSPLLAAVHGELETWGSSSAARVEIPGQYNSASAATDDEPQAENHARLLRFSPRLELVTRCGRTERRLGMQGSDGREHLFLAQTTPAHYAAADEQAHQLLAFVRRMFGREYTAVRRNLSVQSPAVTSITGERRLLADERSRTSLGDIWEADCLRRGADPDEPVMLMRRRVWEAAAPVVRQGKEVVAEVEHAAKVGALREINAKVVRDDVLLRFVTASVRDPEAAYALKRCLAGQLGVWCLISHAFVMNDRTPHRLVFDAGTGRVLYQDFQPGWHASDGSLLAHTEDVPFRLTRNLTTLLSPLLVEAVTAPAMVAAAQALFQQRDFFRPYLALYLRDAMLAWYSRRPGAGGPGSSSGGPGGSGGGSGGGGS